MSWLENRIEDLQSELDEVERVKNEIQKLLEGADVSVVHPRSMKELKEMQQGCLETIWEQVDDYFAHAVERAKGELREIDKDDSEDDARSTYYHQQMGA